MMGNVAMSSLFAKLFCTVITFIITFTLGSVYSIKSSGAEQNNGNKSFKLNIMLLRIPTKLRQTSWPFTSVAEDLNSGLP